MKTVDEYLDREFSQAELAVIGELIAVAKLMTHEDGKPISRMHQVLGAMFLEKAASIIRQEAELSIVDKEYLKKFAKFWDISERAGFNERT
jgi:hypothetical protein